MSFALKNAGGNGLEDGKLSYDLRHIGPEYIEYRPVLFLSLPVEVLQRLRRIARRKRGGEARPCLPQQLIDLRGIRSMRGAETTTRPRPIDESCWWGAGSDRLPACSAP